MDGLSEMSKCRKHVTSGHIEFVCRTIPNLTPSLIFNPFLTPPYSRPPHNPCFLPQGVGIYNRVRFKAVERFQNGKNVRFTHYLLIERVESLFWGLCLKILHMKTAASVHSCVKTTLSEMSCMRIFFSNLFWTNHTSQCISFLHGPIVMCILQHMPGKQVYKI